MHLLLVSTQFLPNFQLHLASVETSRSLAVGNYIQGSCRLWANCVLDPLSLFEGGMISLIWPTNGYDMTVPFTIKGHSLEGKDSAEKMLSSRKDFESFILFTVMHLCVSECGKNHCRGHGKCHHLDSKTWSLLPTCLYSPTFVPRFSWKAKPPLWW